MTLYVALPWANRSLKSCLYSQLAELADSLDVGCLIEWVTLKI